MPAAVPKKTVKKSAVKKTANAKAPVKNHYNDYKSYNGKQYTGMKVGGTHKWYYDKGEWKERKITPDKWELTYSVTKRRAGKAPEGSGVPVGTGYHWFILSHQFVHKLNADDYSTTMVGLKLKLAHKRADKDKWNITEGTKRKHLIQMLKDFVAELEADPKKLETVPLDLEYKNKQFKGFAVPMMESCAGGTCNEFDVTLNDKHLGVIRCAKNGWYMNGVKPQSFVNAIGEELFLWYE